MVQHDNGCIYHQPSHIHKHVKDLNNKPFAMTIYSPPHEPAVTTHVAGPSLKLASFGSSAVASPGLAGHAISQDSQAWQDSRGRGINNALTTPLMPLTKVLALLHISVQLIAPNTALIRPKTTRTAANQLLKVNTRRTRHEPIEYPQQQPTCSQDPYDSGSVAS